MIKVTFTATVKQLDDSYEAMATQLRERAFADYGCIAFWVQMCGADETAYSVWPSSAHIANWQQDTLHLKAQALGASKWYSQYDVDKQVIDKDPDALSLVYQHTDTDLLFNRCLSLCDQPDAGIGASWLIKYAIEQGYQQTDPLIHLLPSLLASDNLAWPTQLHLLQSLALVDAAQLDTDALMPLLLRLITSPNKFVKAYSYHGLALCANQQPSLTNQVHTLLTMALRDEPASVKARVKHSIALLSP